MCDDYYQPGEARSYQCEYCDKLIPTEDVRILCKRCLGTPVCDQSDYPDDGMTAEG
jgi:hypothetical protein